MRTHKSKYQKQSTLFSSSFEGRKGRNVPFFSKFIVFFSGLITIVGLGFFFIGSLFLVVFGSLVNFEDMKFSESDPITNDTKVISINHTNATENEIPVMRYNYSYKIEGKEFFGECYNTGTAIFKDDIHPVQYLKEDPETSRIVGMRKGEFSPFILLFIIIFPLIGFVLSVVGVRKNLKYIKLIKYGKVAYGLFSHKEATGGKVNNNTVYQMFFNFEDEFGKQHLASGNTHKTHRLKDETFERLVYNPENPDENVMIDALPSSVRKIFDKLGE